MAKRTNFRICAEPGCGDYTRKANQRCCAKHRVTRENEATCQFPGCSSQVRRNGLCGGHSQQLRKGKPLTELKEKIVRFGCSFEGCQRPHKSNGYCDQHSVQLRKGKALTPIRPRSSTGLCTFEGCDAPYLCNGWCAGHNRQAKEGKPMKPLRAQLPKGSWSSRNEMFREKNRRRRAQKLGNGCEKVSPEFLANLYSQGCVVCGSTESIHADHIVPLARGGAHREDNLQPLCAFHNVSKGAKTMDEWLGVSA